MIKHKKSRTYVLRFSPFQKFCYLWVTFQKVISIKRGCTQFKSQACKMNSLERTTSPSVRTDKHQNRIEFGNYSTNRNQLAFKNKVTRRTTVLTELVIKCMTL